MTVELSELRDRADDVAASLRRGEPVAFTDAGRLLAQTPASPRDREPIPEERLAEAVRIGAILPPKDPNGRAAFLALRPVTLGGRSLLDHLLEAREEEYREDECGNPLP